MTVAVWVAIASVVLAAAITTGTLINRLGNLETRLKDWTDSRESQGKRIGELKDALAEVSNEQDKAVAEMRAEVRMLREIFDRMLAKALITRKNTGVTSIPAQRALPPRSRDEG